MHLMYQVIAAPTGSGKTVILELAILRVLSTGVNEQGRFSHRGGSLRAVYLAPSKALVQAMTQSKNVSMLVLVIMTHLVFQLRAMPCRRKPRHGNRVLEHI